MNSGGYQNSIGANIRNFKELYHFKYSEKQLPSTSQSSSQQQHSIQNLQSSQLMSPSSQSMQQSKEQLLQNSNSHGIVVGNSPTAIKFPAFTAQQKSKLFLNNTNIIPKKVQAKAKMIQLNLQNPSGSSTQQQNVSSARNSDIGNIPLSPNQQHINQQQHQNYIMQNQSMQSNHNSNNNLHNTNNSHIQQQQQYAQSANISRHQSFQSPQSQTTSPLNNNMAHHHHQQFLSKQQSQSNLNASQLSYQQQSSSLSATRARHAPSNSFQGAFSNNSNNNNSQNSNNSQNENNAGASEQKRFEQYQLLQKYKGTPFLNYMQLNSSSSTGSGIHSTSQQQQQIMQSSYQQNNATRSRNGSSNSQQQSQNMTPQQYERKSSSRLLENKSSVLASPTASPSIALHNNNPLAHSSIHHLNNNNNANNNNNNFTDSSKIDNSITTRWSHTTMSKNVFNYQYVIGKGGFGKVWRVEHKKNKQPYAMKEMSKSKIITKRSVNSVMSERHLLSQLKHPFLVNMNYAFQDRDNLYLVMDLVSGGDLRFHIGRHRRFKENQTRFFIACIVVGLEYLHGKNVIHRDIKPENLVLDTDGYVKVTDLGVARIWKPENSQDTSGTPGYMAPEVMCRQNHGIAVDYFAVGVIAYEFMMGRRPYLGRNRKEIRDQILSKQVQIKRNEIPDGWSIEAADFINRMIQRKPMNRLGVNGPEEVKAHPWIKNFPWEKLLNRQIDAPFIPQAIEDNYDYRQQISADGEDTNEELIQQNAILLRKNSVQNLFAGYNYDIHETQRQQSMSQNQVQTGISQQQQQQLQQQQTGSTNSTNNTNIPSDRSQSALNPRKTPPIQYA